MLIFSDPPLAFVAVPKTGTTAIELALRSKADVVFTGKRKHIPASRYHKKVAPFLADAFKLRPVCIAIMRDPVAQIGSWYRYRSRDALKGSPRYTGDMSFDEFVQDVMQAKPPARADIGSQFNMLTHETGELLVQHLFQYEQMELFQDFLEQQLGERPTFETHNVSPKGAVELEPATLRKLRAKRSHEFELYDWLCEQGGHLRTKVG